MLFYYAFYKNQALLPQPGAVMDQSHKAMSIFRVFDDVNAECDEQLAAAKPGPTAPAQSSPGKGPRR